MVVLWRVTHPESRQVRLARSTSHRRVAQFLQKRGLELPRAKTAITHVRKGFDFFGQNVRKYPNRKPLIKPSKKNGMYKPAWAPYARRASPGSRVGVFIIASPACWVARTASRTAPYFIQSATTGFIASIFPSRNRVSRKRRSKGLSRMTGNCHVRF
jgi:hypothetical protein